MLCSAHSARTVSAYVYTAAGAGESTTDLAWDGQALICENGDVVGESARFSDYPALVLADLDLDRLLTDRSALSSWGDSIHDHRRRLQRMRRVEFTLAPPPGAAAARARGRALPVRAVESGLAQRALQRGLPHSGGRA